jgi:anti-anti-sigma regulatory factor
MKPFEVEVHGNEIRLRLVGEVTVEHARVLRAALQVPVGGCELAIDAAGVTRLDGAVLQVLLAATARAGRVRVSARSDAWDDAFRRYALRKTRLAAANE